MQPRGRRWGANRGAASADAGYGSTSVGYANADQCELSCVSLESTAPVAGKAGGTCGDSQTAKNGANRKELLPGYRVSLRDGRVGEVEFVSTSGEALVALDTGKPWKRPRSDEAPRDWVEGLWPEQVWVAPKQLQVHEQRHALRERRDVADYRHAMCCMKGLNEGRSAEEMAMEVGRPLAWVSEVLRKGQPAKPKNLEHWDQDGFTEVRYLKRRYHKPGRYEEIVQGVDWQQDRVWRVHKEVDGTWDLRTVKQCQSLGCGRSLQRVPDSTVKIGPGDASVPKNTRPHADWCCQKRGQGCIKPDFASPLGDAYYWWCPQHKWYVCQECVQRMPDKPTSKQIRGWYRGECPALDDLVYQVVNDFNLPDPQAPFGGTARYTIKMNWYPDGAAQVSDHRHDIWTILVSLGSPRVLNVDYARVLMEDGDIILFGTQKHGVPVAAPSQGGRLSVVFMFRPDAQIEQAALHLAGRNVPGFRPRQEKFPRDSPEPDAGWSEDQGGDEDVAALLALGFSIVEAEQALAVCDGDATAAANLLLGV